MQHCRWIAQQIHHEYQNLSVVTDTPMKKFRKERMEAEMKQLERDIEAIEKHTLIYIADWLLGSLKRTPTHIEPIHA